MTYPGDGQTGWGGQSGQGDWGRQHPQQGYGGSYGEQQQQQGYGGSFGEQGYGASYGGLGVFSGGEEPPRKGKGRIWLIVGLVVLLVGGGVTAFLLTRPDDTRQVADTGSSTPTPTSTSSSTPEEPAETCEAKVADWNCLPVPDLSYSYEVPRSWSPSPGSAPVDGLPDVKLTGLTVYGVYSCGGQKYNRGSTGGVIVSGADLTAVAKDFAQKLGTQYYSSAPTHNVSVGQAKPLTIAGGNGKEKIDGVQVDATVTTTGNNCLATKGMVKILVLKGSNGSHVFMANGDLEGGPGDPKPALEADLQQMIDSVKPLQG